MSKLRLSFRLPVHVLVIFLVAFTGTAAFRISIPAVAFYARSILEATAFGVGLLTSAFFAGRAVFAVVSGGLADRYGYRVIYLASLCFLLNAIAVQLYLVAGSVYGVFAVRFLQGALNGISWISIQYVLGRSVDSSIRGRVYALYFSCGSVGVITGNFMYTLLISQGLGRVLLVSSVLFVLSSALTTILIKFEKLRSITPTITVKARSRGSIRFSDILQAIPFMVIVIGMAMFNSVVRGDLIYIYVSEFLGMSRELTACLIATSSLIALGGGYIISWISDRFSDSLALQIASSIGFVGAILLGIRSPPLTVLGLALFYIANSGVVPISRRIAITYYRLGGTVIGLVNALGNVGQVIGSSIAGLIYDLFGISSIRLASIEMSRFIILMTLIPLLVIIASVILPRHSKIH